MVHGGVTPRRVFWRSRWHLWLGLLTLGLGFASGEPLGLIAGVTLYAIGLIYLPDNSWFRRQLEQRQAAADAADAAAQRAAFIRERERITTSLPASARQRFEELLSLTRQIETATAETQGGGSSLGVETRLRKLDELAWTYLRLLALEHTLETFLELERRDGVAQQVEQAAADVAALEPATADPHGTRARLLQSKRDRLSVLRERFDRGQQARANLELARGEQQRIVDQLKLLRAELVATRSPDALSLRIDQSMDHLSETNRWLGEMAQFRDLTAPLPPGFERLDLGPPPVPDARRGRERTAE